MKLSKKYLSYRGKWIAETNGVVFASSKTHEGLYGILSNCAISVRYISAENEKEKDRIFVVQEVTDEPIK